jgi:predicted P-loop ATPase
MEQVMDVIAKVSTATADEEQGKRLTAVHDTYSTDIDSVAGWSLLTAEEQAALEPVLGGSSPCWAHGDKVSDAHERILQAITRQIGWRDARFNVTTTEIEILTAKGWRPMTDNDVSKLAFVEIPITRRKGKTVMKPAGKDKALDAVKAYADGNKYDHIAEFFRSLPEWDGVDRIAELAKCFAHELAPLPSGEDPIEVFLRKWLVGAVGRALGGHQNFVLVLMGKGGIGKSYFARWLAPSPDLFSDDPIFPESRETSVLAARVLIHELSELGSVTHRPDVNALKRFLTDDVATVRLPYARTQTTIRLRESYLGTSNPSPDLLRDPTGNRRFVVLQIDNLDWGYSNIDKKQLWAQAYALYQAGYDFHLSAEESEYQHEANSKYESIRHSFTADALSRILETVIKTEQRDYWITVDVSGKLGTEEDAPVVAVYVGDDGCFIPSSEFATAVAEAYKTRQPQKHADELRALVARESGQISAQAWLSGSRRRGCRLSWDQVQQLLDYLR